MADRVVLHLGTARSFSPSLQHLLWTRAASLASAGVAVPGWAPDACSLACRDLLEVDVTGSTDPAVVGSWGRLLREVRQAAGTAVLSSELFATMDADLASWVLADLAPAEVHLVVTARDLPRELAAVTARWGERTGDLGVPAERVHGLAVRPDGEPEALWQQFVAVLGVRPGAPHRCGGHEPR